MPRCMYVCMEQTDHCLELSCVARAGALGKISNICNSSIYVWFMIALTMLRSCLIETSTTDPVRNALQESPRQGVSSSVGQLFVYHTAQHYSEQPIRPPILHPLKCSSSNEQQDRYASAAEAIVDLKARLKGPNTTSSVQQAVSERGAYVLDLCVLPASPSFFPPLSARRIHSALYHRPFPLSKVRLSLEGHQIGLRVAWPGFCWSPATQPFRVAFAVAIFFL